MSQILLSLKLVTQSKEIRKIAEADPVRTPTIAERQIHLAI